MPRGGSKPGERRGGREAGIPNKATVERLLKAERDVHQAKAEGRKLAKEVLEDFMVLFAGMAAFYQPVAPGQTTPAGRKPDEAKFERYARLAVGTASDLAPYQSPTFRAIVVSAPLPPTAGDGNVITLEHAIEMDTSDPIQVSRVYRFIMSGEQRALAGRRKRGRSG